MMPLLIMIGGDITRRAVNMDKAIKDIEKYLELEPESPPQKDLLRRMKFKKRQGLSKK